QVSVNFDACCSGSFEIRYDDVSVTEEMGPPLNPSLSGAAGDGRVDLRWTDYPGASSYVIWRADDTLDEWTHPVATASDTSFTDTNVKNGHQYTYQVAVEEASEVWIFSYEKLSFTPASTP